MSNLVRENPLQVKAFELYYSLGESRSLQAVANGMGKSKRTIQYWSTKFNWAGKVLQRDLEMARLSGLEELKRETLAIRAEYRKVMDALFEQAEKDIKDGKLQIESIEDLEIMIKLDLLLLGEPVERVEMMIV